MQCEGNPYRTGSSIERNRIMMERLRSCCRPEEAGLVADKESRAAQGIQLCPR